MTRFKNKTVIITGGAGGIGKVTARAFLNEGAKVMLVGHRAITLEKALKDLNHQNVSFCVADVSQAENVQRYVT